MKYLLIPVGWTILTAWLIFLIVFKIFVSIIIILWGFNFKKKSHSHWCGYFIPIYFMFGGIKYKTLKDYYLFNESFTTDLVE